MSLRFTAESARRLKKPHAGDLIRGKDEDRAGLAFFGTSVVSGTRNAAVVTGYRRQNELTERSPNRLAERRPQTDFQHASGFRGPDSAKVTLILVVGVFAINIVWGERYMTRLSSIALAVGLTPRSCSASSPST